MSRVVQEVVQVSDETVTQIRSVLAQHGRLSTSADALAPDDDLFAAGLSSHASVNVMLAIEDAFDVEFPDSMLNRSVFSTINAIANAVGQLQGEPAAG
jgi:acyl carrier protein